jgi:hypothetical protein
MVAGLNPNLDSKIHILVCLYGIYDISFRSDAEIVGIQNYTQGFLSKIENSPEVLTQVQTLTLSGGYTVVGKSSESETNAFLYQDFLTKNPGIKLIYESLSQDSLENIAFGYLAIRKYNPKNLIIVCDSVRSLKVEILTRFLLDKELSSKNINLTFWGIDRPDIHPNSNPDYQLKVSLPALLSDPKINILKKLISG